MALGGGERGCYVCFTGPLRARRERVANVQGVPALSRRKGRDVKVFRPAVLERRVRAHVLAVEEIKTAFVKGVVDLGYDACERSG